MKARTGTALKEVVTEAPAQQVGKGQVAMMLDAHAAGVLRAAAAMKNVSVDEFIEGLVLDCLEQDLS